VISLSNISHIPSGTRVIVDTNIFVYWVIHHPRFGSNSELVVQRVENGEITGIIPAVILNELLHRLMIAETIDRGYTESVHDAIKKLKEEPEIIQELSLAWEVYVSLPNIGFELVEDEKGISNLTYYFSKELSLMAKDAAIVSYAHKEKVTNLITNDRDFNRIGWITCWNP
jgi:predicted nucleic acid-binding protein